MNDEQLPESARRAFDSYPHLEPSRAFNRAVLESLSSAKLKRKQTIIGRIEEFLGLGLWQFAGSGALGALLPALVLGAMMVSGQPPSKPQPRAVPPYSMLFSPFDIIRHEEMHV